MGHRTGARRKAGFTAVAAAAVVLLAGCTGSPAPPQPAADPAPPSAPSPAPAADDITPHAVGDTLEFECRVPVRAASTAVELTGPGATGVPDLVYISYSADRREPVQWGAGASYQGLHFAKVGLVLKSGAVFTIEVPAEMRGRLKVGWSNTGYTLADSLNIPGCTSNQADAAWLVYPGGFWLDSPACVPLTVRQGRSEETLHVPIGTSCP